MSAASRVARASTGCDAVNSGGFNGTAVTINIVATVSGFDVGDRINFTASSSGTGSVLLMSNGGFGSPILFQSVTVSPVSYSYTVTGVGNDTSLQIYFSPSAGGVSLTISVTCTSASSPSSPPSQSDASKSLSKGFLLSRINGILLTNPGNVSLLNRSTAAPQMRGTTNVAEGNVAKGAAANGTAMALGADFGKGDDDARARGRSVEFRNSLSQMRRDAAEARMEKERMALGANSDGALPLAYEAASPWDVWVEGRYSAFDDDSGNLGRDGHVGVLYVGSDYRFGKNLIVGALAQFDSSKDATDALDSKIEGDGWMVGPYLSARIHENIYVDVQAAWGRSSNDLTLGTATGDFDTTRWLVRGTLAGNWVRDAWRFTPSVDLAYVEESQDAFTNSAGTFVAGQDVALGRLQFGPEVGYRFAHTATTFIEPFIALRGVWDFDNPTAVIDGFTVGPGDFWGRLEGGLNLASANGWSVRGIGSWDGVGASDYSGYTAQGTINVPLN